MTDPVQVTQHDREKVLKAADELEGLAIIAKQMCIDLRNGVDDPYARVYWLRRQFGYVVADLGFGPVRHLDVIEAEYKAYVSDDTVTS